ncbi:hypothetical protein IEQ34_009561 [Dendrobium chrysotoxum]|uniref:Uncharacterized protein n=1 Tax=Dendrobium chrysotoxum TaxID=161865 RepID=A0AAV7GYX0_DENCH|nr:hypothetical protein IEQ34_009561 [Dendrobium chrysotoxum]
MEKTSDVRRMKEGLQNNLLLEEEIKLKPVIAFDCGMGFHPDTPLNEYKQFSVCWLFRLATEKKLELVQTAKK